MQKTNKNTDVVIEDIKLKALANLIYEKLSRNLGKSLEEIKKSKVVLFNHTFTLKEVENVKI